MGIPDNSCETDRRWLRARVLIRGLMIIAAGVMCFSPEIQAAAGSGHEVRIERLDPGGRGGYAVKVTYAVAVRRAAYWRFKTDFDNPRLVENPNIVAHRLIEKNGNRVITENRYAWSPGKWFRWQTLIHPGAHRLTFSLLNTGETGYDFYDGVIEIREVGKVTEVVQVVRFRFPGAWLWVHLPGRAGMMSVLRSFAQWEQRAAPLHACAP